MLYKFSPNLLSKNLTNNRVGLLLIEESEPLFIIDGFMSEVFQALNPEEIHIETHIKSWKEKFEESDRIKLEIHLTQFFNDLIEKGLIIPHDQK